MSYTHVNLYCSYLESHMKFNKLISDSFTELSKQRNQVFCDMIYRPWSKNITDKTQRNLQTILWMKYWKHWELIRTILKFHSRDTHRAEGNIWAVLEHHHRGDWCNATQPTPRPGSSQIVMSTIQDEKQ